MTGSLSPQMQNLCNQITCEYLEMPGLAVTLAQGAHLWNVDSESCARALDRLVACGFLRQASGVYRRNDTAYRAA